MPICYRCRKNKKRYKGSTLCYECYRYASGKPIRKRKR